MSRAKSRRPALSAAFVRACASNSQSRAAIPIAPSCGDTIGPGVSYRLTADVGPCNAGAGLIIDCARFNIAGHRFVGGGVASVVLRGTGSRLGNGTVRGAFGDGVHLDGEAQHVVHNVILERRDEYGFTLRSEKNTLSRHRLIGNDVGFRIYGQNNRVRSSVSAENGSGFVVTGRERRVAGPRLRPAQRKDGLRTA